VKKLMIVLSMVAVFGFVQPAASLAEPATAIVSAAQTTAVAGALASGVAVAIVPYAAAIIVIYLIAKKMEAENERKTNSPQMQANRSHISRYTQPSLRSKQGMPWSAVPLLDRV